MMNDELSSKYNFASCLTVNKLSPIVVYTSNGTNAIS